MLKHIQHYSIWKYRDMTFDPLGLRTKSQTNLTNGCEFILWEARLQKERTLKSKTWMLKCKRWIWLPHMTHMRMPNSWKMLVCTLGVCGCLVYARLKDLPVIDFSTIFLLWMLRLAQQDHFDFVCNWWDKWPHWVGYFVYL